MISTVGSPYQSISAGNPALRVRPPLVHLNPGAYRKNCPKSIIAEK